MRFRVSPECRCGRWPNLASHSDLAVLALTGEVDGRCCRSGAADARLLRQADCSQPRKVWVDPSPPFFGGLASYDGEANITSACPGHQGGQFYRKSPAGQLFFKHFGENVFRNDLCNADVDLGDLLINEGPAAEAQRHAAKVFGAHRHLVFNGTSTSNTEANSLQVRVELQADCLGGMWANRGHAKWEFIEPGDVDFASQTASAIGDDRLQRNGQVTLYPMHSPTAPSRQRSGCS